MNATAFAWPDIEVTALRLALGPAAMHVRSCGKWAVVVVTHPNGGSGYVVSGYHAERGKATLDALVFAIDRRVFRAEHWDHEAGRVHFSIRRASMGIAVISALRKCPKCHGDDVVRLFFGRHVLGQHCRSCRWETEGDD